mgnify:CR=1 FL=1
MRFVVAVGTVLLCGCAARSGCSAPSSAATNGAVDVGGDEPVEAEETTADAKVDASDAGVEPGDATDATDVSDRSVATLDFCIAASGRGSGKGSSSIGESREERRQKARRIAKGFRIQVGERPAVTVDPSRGAVVEDLEASGTHRVRISYRAGGAHSSFEYDPKIGKAPCLRHKSFYNTFWIDHGWKSCGPCSAGD